MNYAENGNCIVVRNRESEGRETAGGGQAYQVARQSAGQILGLACFKTGGKIKGRAEIVFNFLPNNNAPLAPLFCSNERKKNEH